MEKVLSDVELSAVTKRERKAKKRLADQAAMIEGQRRSKALIKARTAKALAK